MEEQPYSLLILGVLGPAFHKIGLLTRSLNNYKRFPRYAVVIPNTLVPTVIGGLHNSPVRGAYGDYLLPSSIELGTLLLAQIYTSIINLIQSKYQPHQGNAPPHPIQAGEPFVFQALDYMGQLQETATGK